MEEGKVKQMTPQKKEFSLEEMTNIAHQLQEQLIRTTKELQECKMDNLYKRLDYLFKVVENSSVFSNKFVNSCIQEIERIMTIPEEDSENKENI